MLVSESSSSSLQLNHYPRRPSSELVLSGFRDTLDKGTKILYKIHTTLEK